MIVDFCNACSSVGILALPFRPLYSNMSDVKSAAKESGKKKWQDMWDKSDTGRNLYRFRQFRS